MLLMKGGDVAAAIKARLLNETAALTAGGVIPTLAILRVGGRPDDLSYERAAVKRAEACGVNTRLLSFAADVSIEVLLAAINDVNRDDGIHGALILRPLPRHIDQDAIKDALAPEKDVDGMTDINLARVFTGRGNGFVPCTAQAAMDVLAFYGVELAGKSVALIGRSLVVGKPLAMLLLQQNATVTICHTRTNNLREICKSAEIVIAAAGAAGMVDGTFLSPGQIVVDVGVNVDQDGNIRGDVDAGAAAGLAAMLTPVPGGVGSVTTSVLMKHVVRAAGGNV